MLDWLDILEKERDGEEGSFIMSLRCSDWSQEAYEIVFYAMRECCKYYDQKSDIPRWIADLFWYFDWYHKQEVYRKYGNEDGAPFSEAMAILNFNHLAFWLFTGESRGDNEFEPLNESQLDR